MATTVIYTTWDDEAYGGIYATPLAGGPVRKLTAEPGYYSTPRFNSDGTKIVYRKQSGNILLGVAHGKETGIYHMNADGSDATRALESGSDPRFNAEGDRIYFQTGGGLSKEYKSVRLDGGG